MNPNQNQQVQSQLSQQMINPQAVSQQGVPPMSEPIHPPNIPNDNANKKSLFLIIGIIILVVILVILTIMIIFRSAEKQSTVQQQSTFVHDRVSSNTPTYTPTPTPASEEEKEAQSLIIEDPTVDTAELNAEMQNL
jgi:cytoskeletal protein RodZ